MANETTVYPAETVITMNPNQPEASAVAVRDGRILGVGSEEELVGWDPDTIDERFSDKVLMPGFVEAHSHSFAGHIWSYPYVGYFSRTSPTGEEWDGCKNIDEVCEVLRAEEEKLEEPDEPLIAWGVEGIYFDEEFDADVLDQVSEERPILVLHCNGHVASANSALLEQSGITAATDVEGVVKGPDGNPTGLLQEQEAISLVGDVYEKARPSSLSEEAIWNYGRIARNAGITTIGEVGGPSLQSQETVDRWQRVVSDDGYPARISFAYSPRIGSNNEVSHAQIADYLGDLAEESTDKLRFGIAKFFTDGSIQGFTARLNWPEYYSDKSNGIWLTPPEELKETLKPYHEAGLTIFCHCNGDEASEVFIDTVEDLQNEIPRSDHRHSIQHCQMATEAQYRRMANLGICANIFSNHIYYYGDQHATSSIGPDRAERMDACATAKRNQVPFTLHSDAPVTPMSQLHTAWCAVNRVTSTGRTLGENEQISVREALNAVTLGAAYQLKMDDEIGSIEAGKRADFAVLDRNPFTIDPMELRDISVWGTVLGGTPFQAATENN